ncbi:MAG: hypothetical protein U0670_18560 [Anaerolineae bacterium]
MRRFAFMLFSLLMISRQALVSAQTDSNPYPVPPILNDAPIVLAYQVADYHINMQRWFITSGEGPVVEIAPGAAFNTETFAAAWTDDCAQFAVSTSMPMATGDASWTIKVYTAATGEERALFEPTEYGQYNLYWSPGGTRIAYETFTEGQGVDVVNVASGERIRVGSEEMYPVGWQGEDNLLMIYAKRLDDNSVDRRLMRATIGADGQAATTELINDPSIVTAIAAPDGSLLVQRAASEGTLLELYDRDGQYQRRLAANASSLIPLWSHDGERIAYLRTQNGVSIVNVNTLVIDPLWDRTADPSRYVGWLIDWMGGDQSVVFQGPSGASGSPISISGVNVQTGDITELIPPQAGDDQIVYGFLPCMLPPDTP